MTVLHRNKKQEIRNTKSSKVADAPTSSEDPALPSKCADVVMGASKSAEDCQDAPANSSSSGPGTTAADVAPGTSLSSTSAVSVMFAASSAPTDIPPEMADTQADSPTLSDVGDVGTQTYTDDEEVDLSVWYCDHPIFYNRNLRSYKDSGKKKRLMEEKGGSMDPPRTGKYISLLCSFKNVLYAYLMLWGGGA